MPQVIPYVPQRITVHLGAPSSNAANVTVNFVDYVKNVASSEIYPTWEEAALRANILAIVSFALNRVYTEFYRSRGYNFDITNSTAYDQFFVNGRSYFTNVARLVDELFDDYLRRPGFVEPLAAKFCNGTTVTCEGLSQWGSQNLARQGYDTVRILRSYYGNVEIVNNAPIRGITSFYPGHPSAPGNHRPQRGGRAGGAEPDIPELPCHPQNPSCGRHFRRADRSRCAEIPGDRQSCRGRRRRSGDLYALVRYYVAVTSLAELRSQGQRFYTISWATSNPIEQGDRGVKVEHLQYMLSVLSAYIPEIPSVTIDGIYGSATRNAVIAAQRRFGLPETGIVNFDTWYEIYDQFSGIETIGWHDPENYPYTAAIIGGTPPRNRYAQSTTLTQFPGNNLSTGNQDPVRQEAPR